MKAVIMAGGKGTRLKSISKKIPKPMFPILGKPIIEYQIESLKKSGIDDITIMLGYLGYIIKDYFGDGKQWNVNIRYVQEQVPLGSAGALYYLKNEMNSDFVLLFGDVILDIDFNKFYQFHIDKKADITLFAHPNSHPYDSDLLILDDNNRVKEIIEKNTERNEYYKNVVSAGIYCFNSKIFCEFEKEEKKDLDKDIIKKEIDKGNVYAYLSTEYAKDMGTPDRLEQVKEDVKNQVVSNRSLKHKQKAIFIDRDGTINVLKGQLSDIDEFELIPRVSDAIRKINNSKYIVLVVTNQPVIARGECTFEELDNIHKKMETLLGNEGCYINGLYYCPHHPDKGYENEVKELKIDCDCRKPKTGLIDRAVRDYNIELKDSWFIGDSTVDIMTGKNLGIKTILVKTGIAGQDGKYDVKAEYEVKDLYEAINIII